MALRGLGAQGRRAVAFHAGALCLYALSVMFYEIAAGAILLSFVFYRWRAGCWRPALWRWAADVVVVGTILITVTSGSWNEPQPIGTVIRHAGTTADQAFVLLARMAEPYGSPGTTVVAVALGLVASAGAAVALRRPAGDPLGGQLRRWLLTALAGVAAVAVGYAIFVPADPNSYAPLQPGQHNRVNGLAAVGFVVLIYALAMVAGTLAASARASLARVERRPRDRHCARNRRGLEADARRRQGGLGRVGGDAGRNRRLRRPRAAQPAGR